MTSSFGGRGTIINISCDIYDHKVELNLSVSRHSHSLIMIQHIDKCFLWMVISYFSVTCVTSSDDRARDLVLENMVMRTTKFG